MLNNAKRIILQPGGTMYFEIIGSAGQINPCQANQNSGTLSINNSYIASGGNPTRDIPIGTSKKWRG